MSDPPEMRIDEFIVQETIMLNAFRIWYLDQQARARRDMPWPSKMSVGAWHAQFLAFCELGDT